MNQFTRVVLVKSLIGACMILSLIGMPRAFADSKIQLAAQYYSRGVDKTKVGDYKGALADLNKAVELDRGNALIHHELGLVKKKLGDNAGALKCFNNSGVIKYSKGEYKDAIGEFDQALQIKPNYDLAHSNRGLARQKLGDAKGATEDFNEAALSHSKPKPSQSSSSQ
jgi:Tfp pilus assembly protein PilF